MSMIARICRQLVYCNTFPGELSLVTTNLNRNIRFAEANIERYYSKRFTACDNCNIDRKCNKPRNKPRKTPNICPSPPNRRAPLLKEEKKRDKGCTKTSKKTKDSCIIGCSAKKRCMAGMKHRCDGGQCPPQCTLTSTHRKWACNECPKKEYVKPCPTGNWDQNSS